MKDWWQLAKAVQSILPNWHVRSVVGGINIKPSGGMYESTYISMDDLTKVSDVCGTRNINFEYDHGWGGSEITDGDPTELTITVRDDGDSNA